MPKEVKHAYVFMAVVAVGFLIWFLAQPTNNHDDPSQDSCAVYLVGC